MDTDFVKTYLLAQGEMGGEEIVIPLSEPRFSRFTDSPDLQKPVSELPKPIADLPKAVVSSNDLLWQKATSLNDFYNALKQHSIYTKSMRPLSFFVPKEVKINAAFLLLFHSPQELTAEARGILERLFKRLGVDLNSCAISFFFKCNETAMPREKPVLKEMLCKEIELLNPEKIIFFREANTKADSSPTTFAGKPAITLCSLLEMLPSKPGYKEKMVETWNLLNTSLA